MKTCSKCKLSKRLDQFHADRRNLTDGRQSQCKQCRAIFAEKKRRLQGMLPQKRNDPNANAKKCTRCGLLKKITLFKLDGRTTDGKAAECRECSRKYENARNRHKGMKERVIQDPNATLKQCATCCEIKHISEFYAVSHRRNADGRLPHCRNCWAIKSSNSRRKLLHWYSDYARARRLTISNAMPKWLTDEQRTRILEKYWLARDCSIIGGDFYEVDHIIPLKGEHICGLHVPWNLQVIPRHINRRKSNKVYQ